MNQEQMLKNQALVEKAYVEFNNRNIDAILSTMHPDIHWPKAFEGGFVIGHAAVREYWTRQWSEINPKVTPIGFRERENGTLEVDVDQFVKDLQGNVLFDGKVKHIYAIKDGLLQEMNIE